MNKRCVASTDAARNTTLSVTSTTFTLAALALPPPRPPTNNAKHKCVRQHKGSITLVNFLRIATINGHIATSSFGRGARMYTRRRSVMFRRHLIRALPIRTGFCVILYYAYMKEPSGIRLVIIRGQVCFLSGGALGLGNYPGFYITHFLGVLCFAQKELIL